MHDPWSEARCPEIFGGWQLEKIFCSLVFLLWIWGLKCPELSLWGGGCGCEVTRDSVITCCEDEVCLIRSMFRSLRQHLLHGTSRGGNTMVLMCSDDQYIYKTLGKSTVLSQPKPPSQPHIPTARQSLWLYDETLNFNKYHLKSLILLNVRNLTASTAQCSSSTRPLNRIILSIDCHWWRVSSTSWDQHQIMVKNVDMRSNLHLCRL